MQSLFGTDGIRQRVGTSPISAPELHRLGYALGAWACTQTSQPRFIVAQDPRASSAWMATTLYGGLLLHDVHVACTRVLPSPAVAYLLNYSSQFDFGIIISASHNQYHDNGIKILDKRTIKLSHQDECDITDHFYAAQPIDYTTFGRAQPFFEAHDLYSDAVASYFPDNFLAGKKIVLDCANGALYKIAPALFKRFQADVIAIHNQPNGININAECGATHPVSLAHAVRKHQADAGFAFDGDGDRVIAVNKHGRICDGDDILALLSTNKRYQTNAIVGTVMSNHNLVNCLSQRNIELIRADVGDKYVAREMNKHDIGLGGEPSGHIIIRDYLPTGDGLFVSLAVIQTIIETDNHEMHTFDKFPYILINVPVQCKKDLQSEPLSSILEMSKQEISHGRIHVRYSGTEPMLRVMVEDENRDHAHAVATRLAHKLSTELNS